MKKLEASPSTFMTSTLSPLDHCNETYSESVFKILKIEVIFTYASRTMSDN